MPEPERRLLVVGLGNVLCSDDGVGPAAVARLWEGWEAPLGVRVVDGGTLGMALMSLLAEATDVVLVDAVLAATAGNGEAAAPGSPVRLEGDDVPSAAVWRLSPHQVGVADLLDGLRLLGRMPPRLVLLGVVPASLELGIERTPAVEAALPDLVERVVAEAARLGFTFRPRGHDAPLRSAADLGEFHGLRR